MDELLALVDQAENAEYLAGLTLKEAQALVAQLAAGYNETKGSVADAEGVAALSRVVAAIALVDARITELNEAQADVAAQIAALDEQVAAAASTGEGSGEGTQESPAGDGTGEGEDAPAGEGAGGEGEGGDGAGGEATRSTASTSRPSLTVLKRTPQQRPDPGTSEEQEDPSMTRVVASAGAGGTDGVVPGQRMSTALLGRTLSELHETMQTLSEGQLPRDRRGNILERAGGRKLIVGTIPIADRPGLVHQTAADSTSEIIDRAVAEFVAARDERDRMVASGGDCVLAQPDWSIKVIGDQGTCFTDDLPTVAGERPLTYYPWLQINQAASGPGLTAPDDGIGFVTSEQDGAGYGNPDADPGDPDAIPDGGVAYKSCTHIDCPPSPLTCSQEAVYKCVTFGNFQAISHPEYVEAFQKYIDVWFDIERDNRALGSFTTEATAQSHLLTTGSGDLQFGAVSSLKDLLSRLVAKERSARHAPNLGYNIAVPDWFKYFLALDVARHTFGGLDNLRISADEALALAANIDGIRYQTYCTEAGPTAGGGPVNQVLTPNTSGAIPAWPSKVRILVWPDGAVFKKTAGSLKIGLRETLMKTNDFGGFEESFEKVCYRGPVFVLDAQLCPNGATGAPVALTCS